MIYEDSIITFHKLRCSDTLDEHHLYTLTRIDTGVNKKLDKNVILLVDNLSKGMTVLEAAYAIDFSFLVVRSVLEMLQNVHFIEHVERVTITAHSTIDFHRFKISSQPDDHELYGFVRWETDDSLKIDKNVVELVKRLTQEKTVKQAADEINYSIDVVLSILKMFREGHFIKNIGGVYLYDSGVKIKPLLQNVGSEWFSWAIYKPLRYVVLAVGISGLLIGLLMNGVPTYKDFFWTSDIFTVFFSLFLIDIIFLFVHEFAHFCTTKAVGGEAVMRISYRYVYIVAETECFHLGVLTKKQRYLIYLAGITVDLFIVGVLYWFLLISKIDNSHLGLLYNFFIAVILLELLGVIWQFNVFLETDMYNFLSEYLSIDNLRSDAIKYIKLQSKRWKQVLFFPFKHILLFFLQNGLQITDDLRVLSKSEKNKLQIYVLFLIGGLLFITIEFIFYSIPRDITFLTVSFSEMLQPVKNKDITVIKSLFIISIILLDYVLLIILKGKELTRRHHKSMRF